MSDPSDDDSTPMPGLLRWALLLTVLGALGLVLLPADWPPRVLAIERHWCLTDLGRVTGSAVLVQAETWTLDAQAHHDGEQPAPGSGPAAFGWLTSRGADSWSADWSRDRLALFLGLRELIILRLTVLAAWGPALMTLLVAAVLDGHWAWRIRQCGFDYPSPIGRQASVTGVGLLILTLIVELGLPLPLHPLLLPLSVLLCAVLIAIGIRHLPKQL